MPFSPVGTMGAVIQIQEPIQDKKKLLILEWVDLYELNSFRSLLDSGTLFFRVSQPRRFCSSKNILSFGDSLFTYYTGQWVLGPYDPMTTTILIHPLAKAGWVGLLVTAINLFPFGQLDGGHIVYGMFGEKYRNWINYLFFAFIFLGFVSITWVIWGLSSFTSSR